jgi:hypothetical protein
VLTVHTVLQDKVADVTRPQQQDVTAADTQARAAALLAASGRPDAPHRVCADPSGRLAGLPISMRRLVSCKACFSDN